MSNIPDRKTLHLNEQTGRLSIKDHRQDSFTYRKEYKMQQKPAYDRPNRPRLWLALWRLADKGRAGATDKRAPNLHRIDRNDLVAFVLCVCVIGKGSIVYVGGAKECIENFEVMTVCFDDIWR